MIFKHQWMRKPYYGRRRSLSLDDLGLNGYHIPGSGSPLPYLSTVSNEVTETDEEDIDELPEDCTRLYKQEEEEEPLAEEWSPSPVGDNAQSSSLNSSGTTVSSNKSKSIIQNYLAKWKTKIKKQ